MAHRPIAASTSALQTNPRSPSLSALRAKLGTRLSRSRDRQPTELKLPERFQFEDDDEDDGLRTVGADAGMAVQSFYGIVAQAQGKSKFADSLGHTVEENEEDEEKLGKTPVSTSTVFAHSKPREDEGCTEQRPIFSSHSRRDSSADSTPDMMTQSQILQPRGSKSRLIPRSSSTADVVLQSPAADRLIDRKMQNRTPTELEASVATIRKGSVVETPQTLTAAKSQNIDMRKVLADIFHFDEPEELVAEYSCWYLQNVLLEGYLYVTRNHLCFFAYIQKRSNIAIKTGHLAKQGKRDPRYSRFWFVLKGDVFSYYTNAADPYFPSGTVDLRRAISAEMVEEKGRDQNDSTLFTITTDYRVYHFKADSTPSAREWVKQLQKVIFRSHNDGDSVKISVPIANIVDIDSTPVINFADTVRIRAVDDEETYAVEEYCFTFFNQGQEARRLIASMINRGGRAADFDERGRLAVGEPPKPTRTTMLPNLVRPKNAGLMRDDQRRARGGRSGSTPRQQDVSGSDSSPIRASLSSIATSSFGEEGEDFADTRMSASQMLSEDTAFHAPTIRNTAPPRTVSDMTYITSETVSASEASSQPSSPTAQDQVLPSATNPNASGANKPRLHDDYDTTPKSSHVLTAPLHHALSLAGRVRSQSKRMSSYLGTSPKDYYTKFSGAMKGGKRHYAEAEGLAPDDRYDDPEEMLDNAEHERRFHEHFALPESEKLLAVYYCWLFRVLPLYGKIYVGSSHLCFRSLLYGTRTKLNLPFHDVDNVQKERGIRWSYPGMVVVIRGHEELFFDFNDRGNRDDCVVTILRQKEQTNAIQNSMIMTEEEKMEAQVAAAQHELLLEARQHQEEDDKSGISKVSDVPINASPILFDDASASILDIRPHQSLRITCLTIGSRGDVQPYVALCKGLLADGHKPRIATHAEFEPFVTKHGIEFVAVEGDPAELMRICVEYGMFTPSFLYEANSKFRGWLDGLLTSAYDACKGSDLLIESPSAMGGIHIAEALQIPYFRAFTMPWTRTRAYPHAFAVPNKKMGGQYNYMTYFLFDNMFWKVTAGQINRWRRNVLGLKATSLEKLQPNKVPFLYNFSPLVVPPPLDFSDWVRITGYWFLDEGANWTPPAELLAFIAKAREDKVKLVYIGFGSVVVSDSRQLTRQVVDAVLKADVRCILSKGWSDRFATHTDDGIKLPDCIFRINAAPHDWLFRQVDAVVHHGGAGTTGASLRAGVPTIIKPFFGDQFFFATRVEDLGVGVFLKKITTHALGKALWIATHDDRMKTKAAVLGEQIDREDGVGTAIKAIYRDLDYARSLIKKREEVAATPLTPQDRLPSARSTPRTSNLAHENAIYDENDSHDDNEDEEEESWTFVEPDSDVDVTASRSRALSQVSSFLPTSPSTASSMISSGGLRSLGRMNRF